MASFAHDCYESPANQAPSKPLRCRVEKPQENISFDCKKRCELKFRHIFLKGK